MKISQTILSAVILCAGAFVSAEEKVSHRIIAGCFQKGGFAIVAEDGTIEKEVKVGGQVQDTWKLENGNILTSHSTGAKEFSSNGQLVWEYKTPNKNIEIHSAQPLENGNVLLCEGGTKRLYEVNRAGEVVKDIALKTTAGNKHVQFRAARKTKAGTYWIALIGEAKAREIDADGKMLREFVVAEGKKSIHGLIPLPNGNILVSTAGQGEIKEFDKDGQIVWQLTKDDMKNAGIKKTGYTGGMQRLANGNTVVSVYHGEPQFYEVTPDKKMVWSYHNPALKNVVGITILDAAQPILK